MRPITLMICACVALTACQNGGTGESGTAEATAALAALSARVGQLEVDRGRLLLMVSDLQTEMARLKTREAPRVPHLIVRETGEDLGPFAGWDRAWSEELGAYYSLLNPYPLFATGNCAGDVLVKDGTNLEGVDAFALADGRLMENLPCEKPIEAQSLLFPQTGKCVESYGSSGCPASPLGFVAIWADRSALDVTLPSR